MYFWRLLEAMVERRVRVARYHHQGMTKDLHAVVVASLFFVKGTP